ncbi:RNA polymerase sigma-70 factor [Parabacteroides gordonii]|jgi:RNA polymerase sigma-70 factor (family 1)|uniref:RNA polymerase sigma-70 factor n=1 Tax=Parabacteroides gordonii TaxID=574930 RepID=UPI00241EF818|nr:RNA polymerase sigma-70 factor [Parabacteroides gordonii]
MLEIREDIVARINEGDIKAFESLYSTCYVYLCAVATKYIFNSEASREIVNDVFINVWNNRSTLTYPVQAYLIRSVQNRCLNHLRQKRIQMVPMSDVQEHLLTIQEQQIGKESHPLAYLENKEFEERIYNAIDQLPLKCRTIFIEYLYHNKTYEEIAQAHQISTSTVRVQIKIGLTKLRVLLGDLYPLFLLLCDFSEK